MRSVREIAAFEEFGKRAVFEEDAKELGLEFAGLFDQDGLPAVARPSLRAGGLGEQEDEVVGGEALFGFGEEIFTWREHSFVRVAIEIGTDLQELNQIAGEISVGGSVGNEKSRQPSSISG